MSLVINGTILAVGLSIGAGGVPAHRIDGTYMLAGVGPAPAYEPTLVTLNADGTIGSSGTVTSVALTVPGVLFSVSGSPITTSGTLAFSLLTQTANTVFAGPTSGGAATPAFRALVAADIPSGISNVAYINVANVFSAAQTLSTLTLDGSHRLQILDGVAANPASGSGIEIGMNASAGFVIAYNRTGAAWLDLSLQAQSLKFHTNGTLALTVDSSQRILIASIPTSDPGVHGALYSIAGTMHISA